jgi:hypothetical protein
MSTEKTLPRYRSRGLYIVDGEAVGEGSIAMASGPLYAETIVTALNELGSLREQLADAEKKQSDVDHSIALFNKQISEDFETALGPHPTWDNGCWIKRIEELRESAKSNAKDRERLDWLETMNGTLLLSFGSGGGVPTFTELSQTGKDSIMMPTVRQAIDAAMVEK